MINNYEIKIENNEAILYLHFDFNNEIGLFNLKDKKDDIQNVIKKYIKENKINFKGIKIAIVVGGVLMGTLILNKPVVGPIIAGIVGLIPNCASSVIITQLYLKELLSLGAMLSGLLVNGGVGLLILFRENKNIKQNLIITGILYISGVISGILIEIIGITL